MLSSQLAPGQKVVTLVDDEFTVNGPVDLDLVKITMHASQDALVLATNATGVIRRVEIDTWATDGIKVQNASASACHDFQILGGYVRAHGHDAGAHQDGIQVMGGARITIRNVLFSGFDTQGIFINRAGGGATTPTDVVFENCKVGCPNAEGGPATPVNVNVAIRSGLRNCEVYRSPRFNNDIDISSGNINENNVIRPVGYPNCDVEPNQTPPENVTLTFRVRDAANNEASIQVQASVS